MKLTDTQTQILAAAAEQQDRLVKPPAIPPGPRGAIEAKLRSAGLMEQVRLRRDENAAMAWRHAHGEAIGYRTTEAGLAAIGVPALAAIVPVAAYMTAGGPTESTEAGEPSAATLRAETLRGPLASPPESRTGLSVATPQRGLRAAAQAVLAAWDDEAGQRAGLEHAVAALRCAIAGKPARQPRDPSTPRQPREGTKQQQVMTMLRRPEGATIAQVVDATGWQSHTVRGFFAGLKRRQGIAVEVAERVRQVGPGKAGAKGSYSVYRIADAG